jgi:diaminopimelate decarboxylase
VLRLPVRLRSFVTSLDSLPAYVYDLGALDAHVAAIRAALPRAISLHYAVKANPDAALLRTIARHVDGFEVSSAGELVHAAGSVPGAALAFGGPGKTAESLLAAVSSGAVQRFHVESPHELRQLAAACARTGRTADVLLRVNLSAGAPASLTMGGPSPFGMDPETLDSCASVSLESGQVRLRGLHAHLASGLSADSLVSSAASVLSFGRAWCARNGIATPEFNLGGGMAVDYQQPDSVFNWRRYGQGIAGLALPGETLRIEPGRAISAYCGWYVTRVLDIKRSHGSAFAVVAGGTHHLRTPAAKGHSQPFAVVPVPVAGPRPAVSSDAVTVCGQLCTPKDVLAREVPVPRLRTGDLVVFGLAGAYAWNISHQSFLMHPSPAFHYYS